MHSTTTNERICQRILQEIMKYLEHQTRHLFQQPSDPVYYIEDFQIFRNPNFYEPMISVTFKYVRKKATLCTAQQQTNGLTMTSSFFGSTST